MNNLTQRHINYNNNMGNCCEPDNLFNPINQGNNTHHSRKYIAVSEESHSAFPINKSHQVTNSKYSDSISSAHPVNTISFMQSVRPPSLIETPEQMEKLNDSQRMSMIYNSNLKIKNSTTVKWSDYSVRRSNLIGQIPQQ